MRAHVEFFFLLDFFVHFFIITTVTIPNDSVWVSSVKQFQEECFMKEWPPLIGYNRIFNVKICTS